MLDVLRLGAHQLLRMRVPPHAAVSATVDLARRVVSAGPVAFVNAVLRKVAAKDLDAWVAELAPADDPLGRARARAQPPALDRLARSATRSAATCDETGARAGRRRRAPRGAPGRPAGGRATSCSRPAAAPPAPGRRTPCACPRATRATLAAVRDGRAGVQDEGSQLVALALAQRAARRARTGAGSTCAPAPAARPRCSTRSPTQRGARAVAVELQPHRAQLVRRSRGRAESSPPTRATPAAGATAASTGCCSTPRAPGSARCAAGPRRAGGGSRPTCPALTRLQRELLDAPSRLLRPGGVLAYVTCSPHLAETRRAGRRRAAPPPDARAASTRGRCCPACPTSATGPPCSSGRTGTAPTRCTSPLLRHGRRERPWLRHAGSAWRQISPSILSADFARLADEVARVAGAADWAHVDVMDNHFVPNLTLGLPVVESLLKAQRAADRLPPDDRGPRPLGAGLRRGRAPAASPSTSRRPPRRSGWPATCAAAGARAGMALKPATPVEPYADLLPELDMLLVMTVEPGFGGQAFLDVVLPKIRRARG